MLVMNNAGVYTSYVTQQVYQGPLPVLLRNKSVLDRFVQGLQVIFCLENVYALTI